MHFQITILLATQSATALSGILVYRIIFQYTVLDFKMYTPSNDVCRSLFSSTTRTNVIMPSDDNLCNVDIGAPIKT